MFMLQTAFVAIFASVHLFAGRLVFLNEIPRSRWLSAAGGVSVSYIFVHVLPELAEVQKHVSTQAAAYAWIEHHVYLLALVGLGVFYWLERVAKVHLGNGPENAQPANETPGVFWLHLVSFALYNALVGYLLAHRDEEDPRALAFFGLAMAVHFLVNDYGLRQHHKRDYQKIGRWLLAATVVLGWAIGNATAISEAATGSFFAFLAGGVVLNVLKEELPEERKSRFAPFAIGAASYSALLLLL